MEGKVSIQISANTFRVIYWLAAFSPHTVLIKQTYKK
jgi:hypothetical protein